MSGTSREAVIANEQKAVDRAYDCYEARLAEMGGQTAASASASGKDGIAVRVEAEARAQEYGGLGGESLVVMRVDTQEGGQAEPETWYVGRRSVFDVETRDQVVVSWTNPLAVQWRNALPQAPGEVSLRRQLRCVERTVEDYLDEIAPLLSPGDQPGAGDDAVPEPATGEASAVEAEGSAEAERPDDGEEAAAGRVPGPRGVARKPRKKPQPVDEFLLRELRRARSGRMRDIVETIRRDQMALVTGSPAGLLVIQGGPGTGKSAVGLHRVTWLVDNDHFPAQDILVVGPHQSFLEYVGRVLPTLGTRNVNAVQLSRLWAGDIRGTDSPRARLVKSNERMAEVLRRRVEGECRPEAVDSLTTAPSDERDEPAFTVAVGSTSLRLPRSEVLELLREAREGTGAYRLRRDRFRNLLVDRLLAALAQLAPRRSRDTKVRRDLERHRQVTSLIERTWPSLSPEEALRSLLNSPDRLRECADGVFDDGDQAVLRRPRAERAAEEAWTLDDLVCLEELRFLLAGETPQRYRHIVVDEAQDLTPMQAKSLRRRCPSGSMTVLGDLAQATGAHGYTDWDRLGQLLGDQGDWQVAELNTSYRVPAEIMDFVAPLARTIAPSLPYPVAVRRAGDESVRLVRTTPWELLDEAVSRTARLIGTDEAGRSLRSIAVIVPDDSDWLGEVRRRVDQAESMTPQGRQTVSVLAAAQAKGMEFDHVLVLDPTAIAERGPAGLRQLYVALTRSTQSLTVLHPSPLPDALSGQGGGPDGGREGGHVPGELAVGSDIRVRVLGAGKGAHWRVQALEPATERTLLLVVRHGSTPPRIGAELECWVSHHEGRVSLLSASDFGRKPVSTGMAARYGAALEILGEIAHGTEGVPGDAAARLSELKGMAHRCLRRDRADWLGVWQLLGAPEAERLRALRDLAQSTRDAIASKDATLGARLATELARSGWAEELSRARARLRTDPAPAPTPPQRLPPAEAEPPTPTPTATATEPEARDASPVEADTQTQHHRTAPPEALLAELTASAEADRDCNTHEAVRRQLQSALHFAGHRPTDSPVVDVSREDGDGGLFLYEVLSRGRVTYPDIRAGAARLLEINHLAPRTAARLYLVLCGPPAQDWAAETVREVFGVSLLWWTGREWAGQDEETALGQGG
ncbi:AAA family ATPase [Streptomyces sp. N2-109]|uniref:AAA family ATPase n=1 Tax=Streptomyces gossypii TaxID=2883101 RepID=A0ABT2JSA7_9ACTN|nr:ATP-binding domain-containing protein [Streptomyces gossypii]MCT2590773.1 AAA family ATPase [Streptomyces gossypii]